MACHNEWSACQHVSMSLHECQGSGLVAREMKEVSCMRYMQAIKGSISETRVPLLCGSHDWPSCRTHGSGTFGKIAWRRNCRLFNLKNVEFSWLNEVHQHAPIAEAYESVFGRFPGWIIFAFSTARERLFQPSCRNCYNHAGVWLRYRGVTSQAELILCLL